MCDKWLQYRIMSALLEVCFYYSFYKTNLGLLILHFLSFLFKYVLFLLFIFLSIFFFALSFSRLVCPFNFQHFFFRLKVSAAYQYSFHQSVIYIIWELVYEFAKFSQTNLYWKFKSWLNEHMEQFQVKWRLHSIEFYNLWVCSSIKSCLYFFSLHASLFWKAIWVGVEKFNFSMPFYFRSAVSKPILIKWQ